jgi:preprotein translocase subunit SecD
MLGIAFGSPQPTILRDDANQSVPKMKTALTFFLFLLTLMTASVAQAKPLVLTIEKATATHSSVTAMPVVHIILTADSKKKLEKFTRTHIGRRVDISMDGKVLTSPVIRDAIPGGQIELSGGMDTAETKALAEALNQPGATMRVELVKKENK